MTISDKIRPDGFKPIDRTQEKRVERTKGDEKSEQTQKTSFDQHFAPDRAELDKVRREDGRIIQGAKLVYDSLPEEREDKIARAKARLSSGFYDQIEVIQHVAGKMVADPESQPLDEVQPYKELKLKQKLARGYYEGEKQQEKISRGMVEDANKAQPGEGNAEED